MDYSKLVQIVDGVERTATQGDKDAKAFIDSIKEVYPDVQGSFGRRKGKEGVSVVVRSSGAKSDPEAFVNVCREGGLLDADIVDTTGTITVEGWFPEESE